jgi:hypothetical protein
MKTRKHHLKSYRVVWEIDIWAESPFEAAKEALAIQRDPESIATVFKIYTSSNPEYTYTIDLMANTQPTNFIHKGNK